MEQILRSRGRVLHKLTAGAEIEEVLEALCESVEEVAPGMLCSILVADHGRLRLGAGPSLPADYNEAIDGIEIETGVGACSHAAATGETTIVEDIQTHPNWEGFRELGAKANLRACWSQPIWDKERRIVGTLALYYREPRSPERWELDLIEASAEIASIAIDHRRTLDERQTLMARLRQIIDLVPHPIFAKNRKGRFLLANDAVAELYGTTPEGLIGSIHDGTLQVDPKDLERMLEQDREVFDSGRAMMIPEETFLDRDGVVHYYQTIKLPYVQTAGGEPAVLGVAVDITDRKEREEERQSKLLRAHVQQEALVSLATDPAVLSGDTARAFRTITEVVARSIEVERVSVWLLNGERTELHQIDLFEAGPGTHSGGNVILAEEYPRYFEALQASRALDAHDARRDLRTSEFCEAYLEPLDITSMLDAPIRIGGEVVGVVCHEHCSTPRRWRTDELAFAGVVADQAAQALVQRERKTAEEKLRKSEQRYRVLSRELEQRVRDRTRQLGDANAGLRRLTSELLVTEERERRRISADLHDGPCQYLVLAQMKLAGLRKEVSEGLRAEVEEIEEIVDQANRSSRSLTFQLSPPVLHDLGLGAAVEWLGDDMSRTYDLPIHVDDDGSLGELDERMRVILFRAVRELLLNVGKHALARSARVRLRRRGQSVEIVVEDDGQGFDVEGGSGWGFGLSSIRERLSHLGGTMIMRSEPGEGTRVELAAPFGLPQTRPRDEEAT